MTKTETNKEKFKRLIKERDKIYWELRRVEKEIKDMMGLKDTKIEFDESAKHAWFYPKSVWREDLQHLYNLDLQITGITKEDGKVIVYIECGG